MIKAPKTYFEWTKILDTLKSSSPSDTEILEAINNGVIESGNYERLFTKLQETIEYRMKKADEKFDSITGKTTNIDILSPALNNLKREYTFLLKIVKAQFILNVSKEYSDKFVEFIKSSADTVQQSLEDSAASDRTGFLKKIIKSTRVNDLGV